MLSAASDLAQVLRDMGRAGQARELDKDTLRRRQQGPGDDHPDTLISANNHGIDLHSREIPAAARAALGHACPAPARPGQQPPRYAELGQQPRR